MLYRVMVADDEPIMRKALVTLTNWKEIGCEVVYTAANGREVLDCLESTSPDILVTDIRMPGHDGIEIARYIWEKKLPTKVIILTAYADFSYAQSAVKYGVVDYVTKTGAFDGLIAAVEKAKDEIQEAQKISSVGDYDAAVKNLLKSVFDGSLYEKEAIEEDFMHLGIKAGEYTVLLLQYRMERERERRGIKEVYQSLENFFGMVFGEALLSAIPVEKDMFAILLNVPNSGGEDMLRLKCLQIIDMMDNFMQLYTYIGVGEHHKDITELKHAYNEAERAIGYSFISEESKINFFSERKDEEERYPEGSEWYSEKICAEVRKGSPEKVRDLFLELTKLQKESQCSENVIKNTGVMLQSRCRKILSEYDKTIYEVSGMKESISRAIYHCRYLDEYEKILIRLLTASAETIHTAANRKEAMVLECSKYIEEHFEENILVTDIAREIGTSVSYLSRIFKEQTGQTIIYTMNMKKLGKAKEYLKYTDMKIYQIAEQLGFENSTYFSHFFKKYEGISPKEYKGVCFDELD